MIDKAFEALIVLAQKAAAPVTVDDNGETVTYFTNGTTHTVERGIKPRNHNAGSLADVITLANRFAANDGGFYRPVVWYNESEVVLVIDDMVCHTTDDATGIEGSRLGKTTLKLRESDVFAKVRHLRAAPGWHEQKPFERLLRVDLAGTLAPAELLGPVRKIVWTHGSTATATVGRQAESLGRELTSKATTDGRELPEQVKLMVPVYKTPGERDRYALNCSVDIDPAECKLQLLPLPDEIERVAALAVASIGERLVAGLAETVPCYYGSP